jgi:hypothetical protein
LEKAFPSEEMGNQLLIIGIRASLETLETNPGNLRHRSAGNNVLIMVFCPRAVNIELFPLNKNPPGNKSPGDFHS